MKQIVEFVKKVCGAACKGAVGEAHRAFLDHTLTAEGVFAVLKPRGHGGVADDRYSVLTEDAESYPQSGCTDVDAVAYQGSAVTVLLSITAPTVPASREPRPTIALKR